ncbi:MAG: MinD/ParA family protein [Candidatus Dadabacteria bacterium]|nr:MAG: MinD/ParA family protein [Candidatus Dadabacteria bacterium]
MKESYSNKERCFKRLQPSKNTTKGIMASGDCTRVISFTSGKGGVGKTNLAVNIALSLSQQGSSVLLLDADLGLANVDILLGLSPKYNLQDVLKGEKSLDDIMLDGPSGLSIIPAASGIESICNLSQRDKLLLIEAVENLSLSYDYLLIDTRAGISSDVMYFNAASSEIVVVINNEPTSLTDAYAAIKVLATNYGEKKISVISNNVSDLSEGKKAFDKLCRVAARYLNVKLEYMGCVPRDPLVNECVREQRALLERYPSSKAGLAISQIARKLDYRRYNIELKGGMQFFFRRLLEIEGMRGDVA